jgi:hypothetical protein
MKLDKETVVKHQFWFLLGGFLLLWVAALSSLKLLASGPIEAKRKDYEKAAADIKTAQSKKPKNPATFLPPWKEYADTFRNKRDEIWSAAFRLQNPPGEPFETWPDIGQMPQLRYPEDTDKSGQPLPTTEERQEYFTRGYHEQFKGLEKIVQPVELLGGVDAIMQPQNWTKTPSREECWLAQEDLWVKRELLRVVKAANDSVARFHEVAVKPDEKRPEGVPANALHRRYSNYNWQLDLFIVPEGRLGALHPASTVTNVHPARRALPLSTRNDEERTFRLRQGIAESRVVVRGEPVPYLASRKLNKDGKPIVSESVDLRKPFEVEEVFVWETAPVKRIDAIAAPYQSHRTITMALKAKESLKKLDPDSAPPEGGATDPNAAPGGPGGPGMPGMPGPGMPGMPGGPGGDRPGGKFRGDMGPGGPGGMFGAGQSGDPTPRNGLDRVRYLNVTDQCRHMPFAMSLVVDQAHIPDLELALANSRLRIQTAQVEWQHIPGIPPPSGEEGGGAGPGFLGAAGMFGGGDRERRPGGPGGPIMPRMPGGFRGPGGKFGAPGAAGPAMPSMPGGFRGPGGPGMPPGGTAGDAGDEADPNLVELTVYGIAVLYERFPPKPKPEGDANNPAGTPAPNGVPAPAPAAGGANPPAAPNPPAAGQGPGAPAPAEGGKPPAAGEKPAAAGDKAPAGEKPPAEGKKAPAPPAPPK